MKQGHKDTSVDQESMTWSEEQREMCSEWWSMAQRDKRLGRLTIRNYDEFWIGSFMKNYE